MVILLVIVCLLQPFTRKLNGFRYNSTISCISDTTGFILLITLLVILNRGERILIDTDRYIDINLSKVLYSLNCLINL